MDVVILAAGRGSRLGEMTPPFFKPLVIIDGEPLVRRLVRTARRVCGGRVVVVAAPENALPLCQVLGSLPAHVVVQRWPNGPGDALLTGLQLVTSAEVCVLLGDNVMTSADVENVVRAAAPAVGVVMMEPADAELYTYLAPDGSWMEKRSCVDATVRKLPCWVGPLKLETSRIRTALEHWIRRAGGDPATPEREVPVGPLLNEVGNATLVEVTSVDIGIPDAWSRANQVTEG